MVRDASRMEMLLAVIVSGDHPERKAPGQNQWESSRSRIASTWLVYRLLEQAVVTAPITYDDVVVRKPRRKGHQLPQCENVELSG
jgi:hypothetical protein